MFKINLEYSSGYKPIANSVHINIHANTSATSKFAIKWHSYNTSKSQINAVKLANIDSINSVSKN